MPAISPLLTMEAANIYCGVQRPNLGDTNHSNHLRLTDVKLPGMDEQYQELRATGAPVAIEIDTVFARLEATFTLAGWNNQVTTLIDSWTSANNQFWIFGALRDRASGAVFQAKAEIYGRLGRADPQLWRRGDIGHWAYAIKGITRYLLTAATDNSPLYQWDYFESLFFVGGDDRVAEVNRCLNLQVTTQPTTPL